MEIPKFEPNGRRYCLNHDGLDAFICSFNYSSEHRVYDSQTQLRETYEIQFLNPIVSSQAQKLMEKVRLAFIGEGELKIANLSLKTVDPAGGTLDEKSLDDFSIANFDFEGLGTFMTSDIGIKLKMVK